MSLEISTVLGTHNDPRMADMPSIFGRGSYITHEIPATYAYIYAILHNTGSNPCRVGRVFVKNAVGTEVHFLELPLEELESTVIPAGTKLVLGFSLHLFTRCLQWAGFTGTHDICFMCTCDEETYASNIVCLDVNACPAHPLEDMELLPYTAFFLERIALFETEMHRIERVHTSLGNYANLHKHWGIHLKEDADGVPYWHLLEYMPHAEKLWLTTDKLKFQRWAHHAFTPCASHMPSDLLPQGSQEHTGWWELRLPHKALEHGTYVQLCIQSHGSSQISRRVPAMAQWVLQDAFDPNQWCARLWYPQESYVWKHKKPANTPFPRIYEAHIGMSQSPPAAHTHDTAPVGTFAQFTQDMLPRIKESGYTHVQLMGVLEHPLYKSFGYQVTSYFAPSSRFGTVDDFKELVDTAHGLGIGIILDIPHSHACSNVGEGIARYDGTRFFFSDKKNQWGTLSFDYTQDMTRRFLLSNLRYWLEEFCLDGFRFDAVANMLYLDHGHSDDFNHVGRCFYGKDGLPRADAYGQLYISLANTLLRQLSPAVINIAEDASGMPGLSCAPQYGGFGFNYRFAMGIPDFWAHYIKDEDKRQMGPLWYEMTNQRPYDRTISYVECHDQCINGDDAMIWRIIGKSMYTDMTVFQEHWNISRGIALYKLMRCTTLCSAHYGYLNFMGAEFGHPEWLDPETNGYRRWHLAEDTTLRYAHLAAFDKACMHDLVAKYQDDFSIQPLFRHIHEEKRTLAFERGRLLMVYNFHETESQQALDIFVTPGKYISLLSSDEVSFGGHGNISIGAEHFSRADSGIITQSITVYMPPMTALILLRQ